MDCQKFQSANDITNYSNKQEKNGEIKKKHESVIAETSITFTYLPSMSVPVLTVSEYILSQDPNEILKTVNF